jgi:hypothetical protein
MIRQLGPKKKKSFTSNPLCCYVYITSNFDVPGHHQPFPAELVSLGRTFPRFLTYRIEFDSDFHANNKSVYGFVVAQQSNGCTNLALTWGRPISRNSPQ